MKAVLITILLVMLGFFHKVDTNSFSEKYRKDIASLENHLNGMLKKKNSAHELDKLKYYHVFHTIYNGNNLIKALQSENYYDSLIPAYSITKVGICNKTFLLTDTYVLDESNKPVYSGNYKYMFDLSRYKEPMFPPPKLIEIITNPETDFVGCIYISGKARLEFYTVKIDNQISFYRVTYDNTGKHILSELSYDEYLKSI